MKTDSSRCKYLEQNNLFIRHDRSSSDYSIEFRMIAVIWRNFKDHIPDSQRYPLNHCLSRKF